MGPILSKTSFLETREQDRVDKKIPDQKYYFILEKKITKVEKVSQKQGILRNSLCKLQWEIKEILGFSTSSRGPLSPSSDNIFD